MKILYLANVRMPTEKAHGIQIVKACESLSREGVTVELLVPKRYTPITESPEQYYGIRAPFAIRRLAVPDVVRSFGRFGFLLQTLFFSLVAMRHIQKQKPDIIYGRDEHVLAIALLLGASRVMWESHDGSWNRAARYVARHAEKMVVVTSAQKEWYRMRGVRKEKIIALPNGIDVAAFAQAESKEVARRRLGLPEDKMIALYVGSFGGWKGTDTLFDAAALLPEHVRIVVIGGTKEQCEIAAAKYPKIIFLGYLPYRELQNNLAAADMCILPNTGQDPVSVSFTSPLKLLAYMASGRPVVASDLPSVRELTGDTGALLVEADNPEALASGIEKVANETALAESLAKQALLRVQSFDWQARAKQLLAFIAPGR